MKFEWNRRKKYFDVERSPYGFFRKLRLKFKIDLKAWWVAGPYSRGQKIIKLGQKMDFDLVSDGPRFPKFFAWLRPKLEKEEKNFTGSSTITPPTFSTFRRA